MDPNQEDQNLDPTSSPAGQVSAVPRPEGTPVSVSAQEQPEVTSAETAIDHGPEFAPPPQVSEEEQQAGVVGHGAEERHPEVTVPPVSETAEVKPSYTFSQTNEQQLKHNLGQPITTSRPWRARLWGYVQDKLGLRKPQPVQ